MTAPVLEQARCGVIGAGKSGVAAARLLRARGATVVLLDEKVVTPSDLPPGMEVRIGATGFALEGFDLVVVSPGVPWNHPDLTKARATGMRMVAEVELASWFLQSPIAAVTGTNGKSTTTALLGCMLEAGGLHTFVGGNLGTPLSEAVGKRYDVLAVELSSFQLEGIDTFRPHAAAILNLTPDHLDRYPTLEAYADAKARIFAHQNADDVGVLNAGDSWFGYFKTRVPGRLRTFTLTGEADAAVSNQASTSATFAIDQHVYQLQSRALRGAHNLANAMAAALLALGMGLAPEAIQQGLDRFPGLQHRLQLIRVRNGVEWINDSKATNLDSTTIALQAIPGPLIWIAGGRGKGAPYRPLAALLGARLRRSLLIGEDAERIARDLPERAEQVGTLENAVARANAIAQPGDTVLLSPACASYDQFRNYEERGQRFRNLTEAL